jgi:hypothetical protein
VGGLLGGVVAAFNENGRREQPKAPAADPQAATLSKLQELVTLQAQQLQALRDLPGNLPLGTNDMSGAQQIGALRFGRMIA